MQPLEGILVVSLEHAIAAPFATRQLADLGARVIKVERPEGGDFARGYDERAKGLLSHFVWCNRGKESVALDIKKPGERATLDRLLERADVLVQNLAPGATDRLGLSYEALSAKHPNLIVCDISGYGLDGPDRDRKAYDLLIQAESGFLSITGTADEPAKAGCSIADIAAGMYAYSNILAALIERGRTGRGSHIDISMLEAMVEWMGFPMYYAFEGAAPPSRHGARHATIAPYGPYRTADGEVLFGIQNEREWKAFCDEVLERPGLAIDDRFTGNVRRTANRSALDHALDGVIGKFTASAFRDRLDHAGIANARVNDMGGVWTHPQLTARGRWFEITTANGVMPALLPPGRRSVSSASVPTLGEHTSRIIAELAEAPKGNL